MPTQGRIGKVITCKILALALCSLAGAARTQQFYTDYARVVDVAPITEATPVPVSERRCDYPNRAQLADAAFVGDVRANGPGLSIGAAIAQEVRHRETVSAMRRCRTMRTYKNQDRIVAYRVRYVYDGRVFSRRMRHEPNGRVPVRVSLKTPKY